MEEFVDWLWKFFVDDRLMTYQQYVEAKNKPKMQESTSKNQNSKPGKKESKTLNNGNALTDILQSGRLQKKPNSKSIDDDQVSLIST